MVRRPPESQEVLHSDGQVRRKGKINDSRTISSHKQQKLCLDVFPSSGSGGRLTNERQASRLPTASVDADALAAKVRLREARRIYGRGRKIPIGSVKDKKLCRNLKYLEKKYKDVTLKARDAGILLENESGYLTEQHVIRRFCITAQRPGGGRLYVHKDQ
jgi:hypothetical protein